MNNSLLEHRMSDDFKNCHQLTDYESFVLKYNSVAPNHELINQAKAKIASCAKEKNDSKTWPLFILGGVVAIAAAIGLIIMGFSMEGEPASNTYHGEHGDYRVSNFKAILGPLGLFGGIAIGCLGLYAIGRGINMAINRNKI